MKKIVICHICISHNDPKPVRYEANGNDSVAYDGELCYAINGVLARTLKKNDEVKVILLKKEEGKSDEYLEYFKNELNDINKDIKAKIDYKVLSIPEKENKENHKLLFENLINELDERAELFADITYGTKAIPIITFFALNYAEKVYRSEIDTVIYGHLNHTTKKGSLVDMTSLCYLNSIINAVNCDDTERANKMVQTLLHN
jgi:hypothetical protein